MVASAFHCCLCCQKSAALPPLPPPPPATSVLCSDPGKQQGIDIDTHMCKCICLNYETIASTNEPGPDAGHQLNCQCIRQVAEHIPAGAAAAKEEAADGIVAAQSAARGCTQSHRPSLCRLRPPHQPVPAPGPQVCCLPITWYTLPCRCIFHMLHDQQQLQIPYPASAVRLLWQLLSSVRLG